MHGALDDVATGAPFTEGGGGVDEIIAAATKRALERATRTSRAWSGRAVSPMPRPWTVLPPGVPAPPSPPTPPTPPGSSPPPSAPHGAPPWASDS